MTSIAGTPDITAGGADEAGAEATVPVGARGVIGGLAVAIWACDVEDIDAKTQIPVAVLGNLVILLFSTQFL